MAIFERLIQIIKSDGKLLLMLDYDGTLTPIVENPENAVIDFKTRYNLQVLANKKNIQVAIISGRNVSNLIEHTGIQNKKIILFGIHGGEVHLNNQTLINVPESYKQDISNIKQSVKDLEKVPGIIIEDKGYSLSVHYRQANEQNKRFAATTIKNEVKSRNLLSRFRFQEGSEVIEVLPADFNKARAVSYLVKLYREYLPVYFGDDKTDIYAFDEVKRRKGITVLVGNNIDYPADAVVSVEKVKEFLERAASI